MQNSTIQIYTSNDGHVELNITLDQETLWLTQAQMAELFGTKRPAITKHLSNIFKSEELEEEVVCSILEQPTQHGAIAGKTQIQRVKHYNLDAIISVGYRVNSRRATQFRIWATQTLKQHLVQGYTLNQKRLQERGIEFEQAFNLLTNTLHNRQLVTEHGLAVVQVINDYARSWSLLQSYDDQSLSAVIIQLVALSPDFFVRSAQVVLIRSALLPRTRTIWLKAEQLRDYAE